VAQRVALYTRDMASTAGTDHWNCTKPVSECMQFGMAYASLQHMSHIEEA